MAIVGNTEVERRIEATHAVVTVADDEASLLAAGDNNRGEVVVQNQSAVAVRLGLGWEPTAVDGLKLGAGEFWASDRWLGPVHAISESGDAAVLVIEQG